MLFDDPTLDGGGAPDQSSIMQAPGQRPPGIGMGDTVTASPASGAGIGIVAPEPQQAAPERSTAQRIFDALGAFGAGVNGRPQPMALAAEAKRKDDLAKVQQGREQLQALHEGLNVVQKMPAGDAKSKFVAEYANTLGPMGPAFAKLADQPDMAAKMQAFIHDSPTAQRLYSLDNGATLSQEIGKGGDVFKTINTEIDAKQLPILQRKVDVLLKTAKLLDPDVAKKIDDNGYAAHADITALSDAAEQKLPAAFISPAERTILETHKSGIYSGDSRIANDATTQQIIADRAKQDNKPDKGAWGEPYSMNGAMVQKNSVTGEVRQAVSRVPANIININQPPGDQGNVQADAASVAAGQPLSQVVPGYGKQAVEHRTKVRAAAIEQIKADNPGMSDADAGRELAMRSIDFGAGRQSIGQLTKMQGATKQAVSQLDFNIGKTNEEMKKLGSTDLSPILNAIVRGEEKWTGDPAYASTFYYLGGAALEAARMRSGGQASVAQLHQGAQDEAKQWASINMTPASWKSVSTAMQAEGQGLLKAQADAIESQRKGKRGAAAATTTPSAGGVAPFDDAEKERRYQEWKANHK